MSRIKVGIIGTGGISHSHARGYKGNDDMVEIVAVADIDEARAKAAADEWGVGKHFTDYRKILDMPEVDAVSVCTYNQAHAEPTIAALEAGKHVLCEKPMAATLDDAIAMTKASQKADGLLMIAITSRFSADQLAAKRIVESGHLGRIYYGEIGGARRRGMGSGSFAKMATSGAGAVVDIGVYSLDTALHILGHPKPARVSAVTSYAIGKDHSAVVDGGWKWDPDEIEVEEFGTAWIRFDGGMCMVFKTAWAIHGNSMGRNFFLGEKGGIALGPLEAYSDMFGSMVDISPKSGESGEDRFVLETRAFLEAIRDDLPSPVTAEEVLLTNVIMEALFRSAKLGEEVAVAPWE